MSNPFVNFLEGVMDGSGDVRDYQHAARLYVDNNYELTPKAGWIYYTVMNINPEMLSAGLGSKFEEWYTKYRGSVGLLAKSLDLPKFSIETDTLNQYNKKTVIQKKINYSPVSITFHDDMANATHDMWKYYYQYYFADSLDSGKFIAPTKIIEKYQDTKNLSDNTYRYGLSNNQSTPFFISMDLYQLYQKRFTSFKLVNPIIKEWAHDQLDQTQGNKMLASKMTVEYETVIYDTGKSSKRDKDPVGFTRDHYDMTPSPLSIGGNGNNSIFGDGGIISGAEDIFDGLNKDELSPMDLISTAIKGGNLVKNLGKVTPAGILQEGTGILNGAISNIRTTPAGVLNIDGTISKVPASDRIGGGLLSGVNKVTSPVGISLFNSNNGNGTAATPNTRV